MLGDPKQPLHSATSSSRPSSLWLALGLRRIRKLRLLVLTELQAAAHHLSVFSDGGLAINRGLLSPLFGKRSAAVIRSEGTAVTYHYGETP